MSRVFVTGGSGFVGRNLISALRARGHEVLALARSDASVRAVSALGATPVHGGLDDTATLATGMRGCDWVFHAAAHTEEWGPSELFERITVTGTRNVLGAAREAGVRRVIHVSSEAALLDGSPLQRVDETRPLPARPLPLYPASKAASEALVRAANGPALETVILRPRLIWGAGDTSLLPQLVAGVREGRFKWINGGHHLTSTCHVANVVEGLLLAAHKGRAGEIYFLTDGDPVELRGFLTRMLATQGVQVGDASLPRWLARLSAQICEVLWRGLALAGKPPVTRMVVSLFGEEVTVDDGKARRELGYRGNMSIERGLAEMD
ncbi:MAG: NAD-dependent epimerase/dehydratase family protein [Pseudomarimonas sp.]